MKAKLLIVAVIMIGVGLAACKKDQYTTKPQIKLKSVNTERVAKRSVLVMQVEVTDKEGDIQDTLFLERIRYSCDPKSEFYAYKVADFPTQSHLKAELDLTFYNGVDDPSYTGTINNACSFTRPDLADSGYYKIWLKDKASNVSDTITTGTIVIE